MLPVILPSCRHILSLAQQHITFLCCCFFKYELVQCYRPRYETFLVENLSKDHISRWQDFSRTFWILTTICASEQSLSFGVLFLRIQHQPFCLLNPVGYGLLCVKRRLYLRERVALVMCGHLPSTSIPFVAFRKTKCHVNVLPLLIESFILPPSTPDSTLPREWILSSCVVCSCPNA